MALSGYCPSSTNGAGTSLALGAGGHLVSWIGIAGGGQYDAWSAWSSGDSWINDIIGSTFRISSCSSQ